MDWPKYSRCFPKESSVLFKRSDDAKRKQSIYFQKSLNCYAVGGSNTGQQDSKIIVFHLGSVKFSLCSLPVSVDSSGATPWSWEDSEKILVFPMRFGALMRAPVIL